MLAGARRVRWPKQRLDEGGERLFLFQYGSNWSEAVAGCHCSPCGGRLPCSGRDRKRAASSGARKSRGRSHRRRPCRQARRKKELDFPKSIVR